MELISFGAAQTVTGSKHLLRTKFGTLLIDCGLYQGTKKKNVAQLPDELHEVDAVILTHGHLDHCGYLPKLVKHGFQGPVFCSAPTAEIAKLIMADNAKIQASEVRSKNRKETAESKKVKPLYDLNDVAKTIVLFQTKKWDETFHWKGLEITFSCAGHILGASIVRISDGEKSIVFSGDLGRNNDPIMPAPKWFNHADAVVMECTYGDRNHDQNTTPMDDLIKVLKEAKSHEGTVLIPAFSVARSQNILYYLSTIFKKHPELKLPLYVDSPLTTEVTKLYERFDDYHQISDKEFKTIHKHSFFIEFKSQRDSLEKNPTAKIILSASGMMTGGLVPHYLNILSHQKNNILMVVGYQAEGTLGRDIVEGLRDIFVEGQAVTWQGQVFISSAFSSHADQQELLSWLGQHQGVKQVFLVHGEEESLRTMKQKIGDHAVIVVENASYKI